MRLRVAQGVSGTPLDRPGCRELDGSAGIGRLLGGVPSECGK